MRDIERSYDVAKWIDLHLPKTAKIFNAEENRSFYFNRPSVRETWFRHATNYSKLSTAGVFALLKENGFTHVIRVTPLDSSSSDPYLEALDKVLTDKHYARLLVQVDSENKRESRFQYHVFELFDIQNT